MLGGSPHRRSRAGLWFAAFSVASLLMLLASRTEPALFVQQATARAIDPVRSAIAAFGQGITGMVGAVGEIDRLRSENDRLRSDLAGAQQRIAELTEAASENAELRQLLGLTTSLHMDLLPVRVISRDPSNFTWELGIDAGSKEGLRVGMPVVGSAANGAGGLAGTVVSALSDTATVRLVVDTRSSVVALDQQSRALGLVSGQLGGQLVMVQVPVTEHLVVGDPVVTAGITFAVAEGGVARSSYPKGLLLGRIQAIEQDSNALTQTAFVSPAIDFGSLDRLLVVLHFDQG
jgi:rod shape-determining protein MreC